VTSKLIKIRLLHLHKQRPLWLIPLAILWGKQISLPVAAQVTAVETPVEPRSETLPSPLEPALPPIEPIQPETLPEPQAPPLEVEPVPPTQPPVESPQLDNCLPLANSTEARFTATNIEVVGNTVLQSEIEQAVACYEGQNITLSDLFSLRSQITQLYLDNGYITSGAFIPNGQIFEDTVQVQVIEGSLETVQINGLSRLAEGYVSARIEDTTPLNQQQLQESLQILQLDPNIQSINAELAAGSQPGQSLLVLDIVEPSPFTFSSSTDNHRSPSVGATGLNLSSSYRNLLGIGDVIFATYGLTEGLDLYDIGLSIPFNAADGTFNLRYNNSDSRIVEGTFSDIGIRSDTQTISAGIRQPIVRTPSQEFALGLDFDWRSSQSYILNDVPFSFSEGPDDGLAQVSAIRFYQEWTQRDADRVLAARSQFSLGLNTFGATRNDTGPDGQFFSWLGQFQWVEQVSPRMLSLVKVNAQITPDALLSLERFSLGGVSTVRGYPQNHLVTDNAFSASAELRIPLTRDLTTLQIAPFVDTGIGWNNTGKSDNNFLLGTGVGLRWQATPDLFLRADYGIPLLNAGDRGDSLQDNGLYFSLTYTTNFQR
jgi:hemolysin activation/secretion protein